MLEDIFKNPKEKTDFIIALVVAALFMGAIVYGSTYDWTEEDLSYATLVSHEEVPEVEDVVEAISVDLIEEELEVNPRRTRDEVAIESWTPVVVSTNQMAGKKSADQDDLIIQPTDKASTDMPSSADVDEAESNNEQPSEATISPVIEEKETDIAKEPSSIVENDVVAPSSENIEVAPDIRATGDCQIIVGAYSSEENRQRMLDKLLSANFVTYTYRQRGLHVAAVKVSCDKATRRKALEEIRKNFAKGAFIPKK